MLGALAFSVGFIALVLGRSELFTENSLIPVMAVVAGRGQWRDVARLWTGTMVANLAAGWVIMAIAVAAVPELRTSETLVELGGHFPAQGIGLDTFASAVLGNVVGGVGLVTVLRLAQATGAAQRGPREPAGHDADR